MKTILDTIVDQKRKEVAALRSQFTYADFERMPNFERASISLADSIKSSGFGIIAEMKRKSPSAGEILEQLEIQSQGEIYERAKVAGISCLTDNEFFGGSTEDLQLLRETVKTPILRKELIIDEIQLFESKAYGADAVLLIAELLSSEEALHLTIIAQSLGMEVIMECHDLANLNKINDQVDIIGVNNRDLHLQKTDIQTSKNLFPYLPKDKVLISESGIRSHSELLELAAVGYDGALIGESILKQSDPAKFIASLQLKKQAIC
ncbi:MAG: indole-3-glycerol phosphate synthase TrpC [Crocinitomicaceae bacterium]|nr:indole-3-glycerol phosphate synthase TrpC [Crocinitomicaceae bacterium]